METCSIEGLSRAALEGQGRWAIYSYFFRSKEGPNYLGSATGAAEGSTPISQYHGVSPCAEQWARAVLWLLFVINSSHHRALLTFSNTKHLFHSLPKLNKKGLLWKQRWFRMGKYTGQLFISISVNGEGGIISLFYRQTSRHWEIATDTTNSECIIWDI